MSDVRGAGENESRRARLGARLTVIALLALPGATLWGRSSSDDASLARLLAAHRFSPAETRAVLATVERAEARGLPAGALQNRLREGLTRHARPTQVERVLDRRLAELSRAAELERRAAALGITPRDREASLTRLADSFGMGVRPEDVAGVLPAAAGAKRDFDSVTRAGEVMGRLARQGVPPARTRDVVGAALSAGWSREQMDGLVGVYDRARRRGLGPRRTRRVLAEGIRGGKDLAGLDRETAAAAKASPPSSRRGSAGSGSPRTGKDAAASPRARPQSHGARPPSHGGRPPSHGVRPHGPATRPHVPPARPHQPPPRPPHVPVHRVPHH